MKNILCCQILIGFCIFSASTKALEVQSLKLGYLFSDLPREMVKDFYSIKESRLKVSLVHPERHITRIEGFGLVVKKDSIFVLSKQRFTPLPDFINPLALFDSMDDSKRRKRYSRINNSTFWSFTPDSSEPDDFTDIPSGPQPVICGTILCACVVGSDDRDVSCDGMNKLAQGGCTTDDSGIKVCCQAAGTNPVDINGGTTTTCQ